MHKIRTFVVRRDGLVFDSVGDGRSPPETIASARRGYKRLFGEIANLLIYR